MKVNYKSKIMIFVISFSLLLIGFIGWGYSSKLFEKVYKRIVVSKECINIKKFKFSDYCEEGFINDYTVTNTAYFDVNVSLDFDSMRNYVSFEDLSFTTKLKYGNLDMNLMFLII